jgi:hypothetical protein
MKLLIILHLFSQKSGEWEWKWKIEMGHRVEGERRIGPPISIN